MHDMLANAMSPTAWIIILVVVLVLFGGSRIPEMMKGLGTGMKEFKKGLKEDEEDEKEREAREARAAKEAKEVKEPAETK
jgi:sec-independent protein translocase protein TatA